MDTTNYSSFKELLRCFKAKKDLDYTSTQYNAMLETLEEYAQAEREGKHPDPAGVVECAIKKLQTFEKVTQPSRGR